MRRSFVSSWQMARTFFETKPRVADWKGRKWKAEPGAFPLLSLHFAAFVTSRCNLWIFGMVARATRTSGHIPVKILMTQNAPVFFLRSGLSPPGGQRSRGQKEEAKQRFHGLVLGQGGAGGKGFSPESGKTVFKKDLFWTWRMGDILILFSFLCRPNTCREKQTNLGV